MNIPPITTASTETLVATRWYDPQARLRWWLTAAAWVIAATAVLLATIGCEAGELRGAAADADAYAWSIAQPVTTATQTVTNEGVRVPRQAPTVLAPSLAVAPETCMGSTSVGVSTVLGGGTLGHTWTNDACNRRRDALVLDSFGLRLAAVIYLATGNTEMQEALRLSGIALPSGASAQSAPSGMGEIALGRRFSGAGEGP